MQPEIRFIESQWRVLKEHLLQDRDEHAAVLLCGVVAKGPSLVCREVALLHDDDVSIDPARMHLEVSPIALARLAKRSAQHNLSMVVCHSHPIGDVVRPSPIDLTTEAELCGRVLPGRLQGRPAGALIVGPAGASARVWESGRALDATVRVIGASVSRIGERSTKSRTSLTDFERQEQLWGKSGQRRLGRATAVVVGVGGTGSHVAVQLAHLGIGRVVLIDYDIVERSNLSRVIGSSPTSIGAHKVDVVAAYIRGAQPDCIVEPIAASVLDIDPGELIDADVIVSCTDGHGSRSLLSEIAVQYLVPVVDLGIEVQPGEAVSRAGGGVRILRPDGPCLQCMRVLDAGLVREEFLTDDERANEARRGYLRSANVSAPSVIALNGVVASLAVVEVCDLLLGVFGTPPDRLLYRAERRAVTTATVDRQARCYICGNDGLLGLGDSRRLPRRQPRAG